MIPFDIMRSHVAICSMAPKYSVELFLRVWDPGAWNTVDRISF